MSLARELVHELLLSLSFRTANPFREFASSFLVFARRFNDASEHALTDAEKWGGLRDSNPRPLESQSSALTN
jgi:hypothetical protein